jgi:hypothetical protein
MRTIVKCIRADHGECKHVHCAHYIEHEPKAVNNKGDPCTAEDECPVIKKITYCKLKMEN